MSTAIVTLADMLHELGDVPPERIRWKPYPGTATEKDLLRIVAKEDVLLELVDGILVEKAMGYYASRVTIALAFFLELYLAKQDLGVISGPDGLIRLAGGLVRAPDLAFFPWRLFPNKELPSEPIPELVPELVVEVLSESNTPGEMARKHREYFDAGVKLIWEVDPEARRVRALTGPDEVQQIEETGSLTGADVLPGFRLPLKQLFQRAGLKQPTQGRQARGRKGRR